MASVNTFTFVWDRILKLNAFVKTFKVVGDQTLKLNALVTSSRASFLDFSVAITNMINRNNNKGIPIFHSLI